MRDPGGIVPDDFDRLGGYRIEDPFPFFARARLEAPVFFSPALGAWLVTRYDDVCAILKDPTRFSSAESVPVLRAGEAPREVREILAQTFPRPPALIQLDPPAHGRLRGLLNKAFTAERVARLEPSIRATAHELVDGFTGEGRCDIVHRFCHPLPLRTIAGIVGVPGADVPRVKAWCDAIALGRPYQPLERQIEAARATVAIQGYFLDLVARRRAAPEEELLDALVGLQEDGRPALSGPEVVSVLRTLIFAGHETTAHLIGTALLHLLRRPSLFHALREAPSLVPSTIEEVLRFDGSVVFLRRTTTAEVEIAGVTLQRGARVMLMFASANRDEARFPSSDVFDPERKLDAPHLAFGRGIHFCLGAVLARLQARIALETLGERLPGLHLAPDQALEYLPDLHMRGLAHLDLCWSATP